MDSVHPQSSGISIQVSLSGYSFRVFPGGGPSGWMGSEQLFTMPEFQHRYREVEISLLTPKVALVPESFFDGASAREALAEVAAIAPEDTVDWVDVPEAGAVLVYSLSIGESLSKVLSQTVLTEDGNQARVLPEMYYLIRALGSLEDYNKIVASWRDGWLHLVIAQGKSLRLANVFQAPDFTTAQYFLFLAMKKLQLNPEVSTVCFRTPLDMDSSMSLYRYFKAVVQL